MYKISIIMLLSLKVIMLSASLDHVKKYGSDSYGNRRLVFEVKGDVRTVLQNRSYVTVQTDEKFNQLKIVFDTNKAVLIVPKGVRDSDLLAELAILFAQQSKINDVARLIEDQNKRLIRLSTFLCMATIGLGCWRVYDYLS